MQQRHHRVTIIWMDVTFCGNHMLSYCSELRWYQSPKTHIFFFPFFLSSFSLLSALLLYSLGLLSCFSHEVNSVIVVKECMNGWKSVILILVNKLDFSKKVVILLLYVQSKWTVLSSKTRKN